MGGDLVLELIVTRVSGFFRLGFVFRQKPEWIHFYCINSM